LIGNHQRFWFMNNIQSSLSNKYWVSQIRLINISMKIKDLNKRFIQSLKGVQFSAKFEVGSWWRVYIQRVVSADSDFILSAWKLNWNGDLKSLIRRTLRDAIECFKVKIFIQSALPAFFSKHTKYVWTVIIAF